MFYATFKDTETEIAEFETEKERDNWVSFQDPISLILNTTPENAPFERVVYDNQKLISLLHNDLLFKKGKDILDESITWYTMRTN